MPPVDASTATAHAPVAAVVTPCAVAVAVFGPGTAIHLSSGEWGQQ